MKNTIILTLFLFLTNSISSQVTDQKIESAKLGETRTFKIQVPKSYETNTDQTYPLFIVLDGDYLFDIVAGNVRYYAYWEDIPEAIIIGVNQEQSRDYDTMYSEENFLPIESGADFFEFIGLELVPFIEQNYRTANFRIAVGHGKTANFINYYLFKSNPLFQAYINISPELAPEMEQNITKRFLEFPDKYFYYLATASNDLKRVRKGVEALNINLSSIKNEALNYSFDDFQGPTHYSVAAQAIPKALEHIFYAFQPISKQEYKDKILVLDYSPVDYLKEKYQMVNDLFGINKKVLINDFRAISSAIEKNELYEYYQDLSRLASKDYPDTLLGTYYLARYYEEMGEPKKAYRTYKSGYVLYEVAGITKDYMLEMAEQIKADFGF